MKTFLKKYILPASPVVTIYLAISNMLASYHASYLVTEMFGISLNNVKAGKKKNVEEKKVEASLTNLCREL